MPPSREAKELSRSSTVVVAQSGGPRPVINASLRGVADGCRAYPGILGVAYAGQHGIEVALKEALCLLSTTPAAGAVGTCRYRLKAHQQEDLERIVNLFKGHDLGTFFYNGLQRQDVYRAQGG